MADLSSRDELNARDWERRFLDRWRKPGLPYEVSDIGVELHDVELRGAYPHTECVLVLGWPSRVPDGELRIVMPVWGPHSREIGPENQVDWMPLVDNVDTVWRDLWQPGETVFYPRSPTQPARRA